MSLAENDKGPTISVRFQDGKDGSPVVGAFVSIAGAVLCIGRSPGGEVLATLALRSVA